MAAPEHWFVKIGVFDSNENLREAATQDQENTFRLWKEAETAGNSFDANRFKSGYENSTKILNDIDEVLSWAPPAENSQS